MPQYRIFPAIGVARIGQSDDFFVGPEVPGQGPTELDGAPVVRHKNAGGDQIRKQAARFRLFESDNGSDWRPAEIPVGARLIWTVTLANRKAEVVRGGSPPLQAQRPQFDPAASSMGIRCPKSDIAGMDSSGPALVGEFKDGTFTKSVELGQLRTDAEGNLLVLGGSGVAAARPGRALTGSFYRNPGWFDDVSDGPVTAKVIAADGSEIEAEGGAWVVVAPPDYAPEIEGIVTLFDVIRQVGVDSLGAAAPDGLPSFDRDILPIIQRFRRLRWTNDSFVEWSDPRLDSPDLRSRDASHQALREGVRELVLTAETNLQGTQGGDPYRLRTLQTTALKRWADGDFDDAQHIWPAQPSAEGLTRAALEGTVGQGFFPGIEAGIIVLDPGIYVNPFDFRIDHSELDPGDLTALMAQPWQADFQKCNTDWWPSQRPDIAAQSDDVSDSKPWNRGAIGHAGMIANSARLGFIVRQGENEVFVEAERDPGLG